MPDHISANYLGWTEFDTYVKDDEVTADTEDAHRKALACARLLWGDGFAHKVAGASLRILTPLGYLVEVRGQRSATAHGNHGAHPGRIANLRELAKESGHALRMLFFEQGAATVYAVWLESAFEPDIVSISKDSVKKRQGWPCAKLDRLQIGHRATEDAAYLLFPAATVPLSNPTDAGRLI